MWNDESPGDWGSVIVSDGDLWGGMCIYMYIKICIYIYIYIERQEIVKYRGLKLSKSNK